ncbi:MAG: class I SAM-dependent methyltransferase [Actinomycetota bacterium]|nr:class I SAM-dependent methyltransferase [Actinomycetota bacterium]
MARVDYEQIAPMYDAGRDHRPEHRAQWRVALEPFIDSSRPLLDAGAGTGQWSLLLADWFSVEVEAVEPSAGMWTQAVERARPRVNVREGSAQQIPLPDNSVGTAWMSAVWHHIPEPSLAAAELHRVLVSGASLCIRGAFPDARPDQDITVLRAFPEAHAVLATFPTISQVNDTLTSAGLTHQMTRTVAETGSDSARDAHRRAAQRADTLLRLLPDDIYRRRLATLAAEAEREPLGRPRIARLTMLAFTNA